MFIREKNDSQRQLWLKSSLSELPVGASLLDVGAGMLRNRVHCRHLNYVSQDFCQYAGKSEIDEGLQNQVWGYDSIDLVSDITSIPSPDCSFEAILCSEVLEHVPEPTAALDEFTRLLKPGGTLILTAPFASNVHMAPYHFCSGFSKYWYEHHLSRRGFEIIELVANGDWHDLLFQEISRLGGIERKRGSKLWPLAYLYILVGACYYKIIEKRKNSSDLACFGFNVVARLKA